MRKKAVILFLFLVSISLLAIIGVYSLTLPKGENNNEFYEPPVDTPSPPFSPPDFSNQNVRVGQGETASTNMTFSSWYYEEDLTVSFSLELGAYQNLPVASDDLSPFVAIFDPDPLVLKYLEPKTVTITITADDDTPFGLYTMTINWADGDKGGGATLWITVVE